MPPGTAEHAKADVDTVLAMNGDSKYAPSRLIPAQHRYAGMMHEGMNGISVARWQLSLWHRCKINNKQQDATLSVAADIASGGGLLC